MAAIDWGTIGQLLWVAPLAGLSVALTFSLLILGTTRADDARRDGARTRAAVYSSLALVAGLAFLGTVVYAVEIMATK